ncbi:hypothetical protein [Longispora fulva]|uniref:Uncharacterized protein n=1 Tax=Longispora fulva TaxID=619741 RepID=A0A8J7KJQ4_9ACTN|nr:hypothetical protein [Longispora fulva]MBG6140670.1 hypothetical protein [Longispora fulva]
MKTLPAVLCCSPRCARTEDKAALDPRPAAPGYVLCWTCRDRAEEYLTSLARLYLDCEAAMIRATGLHDKVSGTSSPGLPLNLVAAEARSRIVAVLAEWAGMVVDERGVDAPKREAGALVDFLLGQLRWLGAHPAAGDLCDELADLVHAADRAAYPSPPRRTQLGRRCLFTECGGVLVGVVHVDRPERSRIECDLDPAAHRWARDQWMAVRRAAKVTPVARPVGMAA